MVALYHKSKMLWYGRSIIKESQNAAFIDQLLHNKKNYTAMIKMYIIVVPNFRAFASSLTVASSTLPLHKPLDTICRMSPLEVHLLV